MSAKLCACCGLPFQPVPQVPDQAYCSQPACQRARRNRWNQRKLNSDPDYRDNKRRSQRNWLDRNPDYWRQYRSLKSDQVTQDPTDRQSAAISLQPPNCAKKDESNRLPGIAVGIYRITPIQREGDESNASWTVEIVPICLNGDCELRCKVDACKDRT